MDGGSSDSIVRAASKRALLSQVSEAPALFCVQIPWAFIGAALSTKVKDVYSERRRLWVRLHEKGGKRHEMLCHHNFGTYLLACIEETGIAGDPKGPLFRTIGRRTKRLTRTPLPQANAWAMARRRARSRPALILLRRLPLAPASRLPSTSVASSFQPGSHRGLRWLERHNDQHGARLRSIQPADHSGFRPVQPLDDQRGRGERHCCISGSILNPGKVCRTPIEPPRGFGPSPRAKYRQTAEGGDFAKCSTVCTGFYTHRR